MVRLRLPPGPPVYARVAQQQRHGVENAASAGANPATSTSLPSRLIVGRRALDPEIVVRVHARQPIPARW
jgi:hypothetical protein